MAAEYGGRGNNTVETLRLLINAKADFTARDFHGATALGCAVRKKKSDVIDFLTSLGARM